MKRSLLLILSFLAAALLFLALASGMTRAETRVSTESHSGKPRMTAYDPPQAANLLSSSAGPAVVLYDQYDNPDPFESATSSQVFGGDFSDFDDQLADDFIVPASQNWSVSEVDVLGYYDFGGGPADSVNVYFYLDSGSLPGTPVITQTNLPYTGGNPEGSLIIPTAPVALGPGHYWVSVQVNQDYETLGQWVWADRAAQSNDPAAWRNPRDGFGTGCLDWDTRGENCGGDPDSPDQVYRLLGTLTTTTTTPTPTGTPPTPTPTACVGNYTYSVSSGATIVPGVDDTLNHCVDCTTVYNLPFEYTFYGVPYTRARIGSNGTFQFTGNSSAFIITCLPDLEFGSTIFALWDDLDTGFICEQGCGVYSSVSGTAPNRIANIEWRAEYVDASGIANFELRLYEGQSRFDLVYGQVDGAGGNAVVGVQRQLGELYTQYSCQSAVITQGLAISFTLQACATSSVTPVPTSTPTSSPTATSAGTNTPVSTLAATDTPGTSVVPSHTATAAATSSTTATAVASSTACPLQFTDVPSGSTFYTFIRCLACRDIINGYPDGSFKPNNQVTRGQLSKIVSNSAGLTDPQTDQMFEDVPVGSTFFDFVGRLASRGYIGGYPCGGPGEPCNPPGNRPYFRPNANATRGQISKIVSNASGFIEPVSGQTFQDVAPGSTFYDFIERLASRGVMSGYPCGGPGEPCVPPENRPYFRPNSNATRGQTSKIVANTFYPNCSTPLRP
jgi:hypothetical protein